jgi:hypothetical protein
VPAVSVQLQKKERLPGQDNVSPLKGAMSCLRIHSALQSKFNFAARMDRFCSMVVPAVLFTCAFQRNRRFALGETKGRNRRVIAYASVAPPDNESSVDSAATFESSTPLKREGDQLWLCLVPYMQISAQGRTKFFERRSFKSHLGRNFKGKRQNETQSLFSEARSCRRLNQSQQSAKLWPSHGQCRPVFMLLDRSNNCSRPSSSSELDSKCCLKGASAPVPSSDVLRTEKA